MVFMRMPPRTGKRKESLSERWEEIDRGFMSALKKYARKHNKTLIPFEEAEKVVMSCPNVFGPYSHCELKDMRNYARNTIRRILMGLDSKFPKDISFLVSEAQLIYSKSEEERNAAERYVLIKRI